MANILIIEDDKLLSDAYKLILKRHGHKVSTAYNGKQGLEKATEQAPKIILLDLLMPEMGGIEFLEKYNKQGKPAGVSIVILSNLGDEKKVQKAMTLGAYKYIVKAHAKPEELAMVVDHLVSKDLSRSI